MDWLERLSGIKHHPTLEDLILIGRIHDVRQRLKSKDKLTITEIAEELNLPASVLYKRLARFNAACAQSEDLRKIVGPGGILGGSEGILGASPNGPFFDALNKWLESYAKLLDKEREGPVPVRIGGFLTVSKRFLAPALRRVKDNPNLQIQFFTNHSPHEAMVRDDLDLVLCIEDTEKPFDSVEGAKLELHPCVLMAPGPKPANKPLTAEDIRKQSLVLYRDPLTHQGFDRRPFLNDGPQNITYVQTFLEAHAVAIAGAGIGFSYRELIAEEEDKLLQVWDLNAVHDGAAKKMWLCLRRPPTRPTRSQRDSKQIDVVEDAILDYLKDMAELARTANQLGKKLGKYRFAYYSVAVPGSKGCTWLGGETNLQTTPRGLVKGWRKFGTKAKQIFGRLIEASGQCHLLWREKFFRDGDELTEQDAVSFVFNWADLDEVRPKPLVGAWIGLVPGSSESEFAPGRGWYVLSADEMSGGDLEKQVPSGAEKGSNRRR